MNQSSEVISLLKVEIEKLDCIYLRGPRPYIYGSLCTNTCVCIYVLGRLNTISPTAISHTRHDLWPSEGRDLFMQQLLHIQVSAGDESRMAGDGVLYGRR